MAGFFGFFDYTKPGPGVPENEPPKSKFIVFFEVLARKFWKLCWLNILYFLVSLPILILLYFIIGNYIAPIIQSATKGAGNIKDIQSLQGFLMTAFGLTLLSGFMVFGIGPTTAGFTYIVRNFAREEHAWVTSDFFEHTKKNLKEGIISFITDLLVLWIFSVAIRFYSVQSLKYPSVGIIKYFLVFTLFIYFMMHIYIYPMMVTYNLKVRHIYKNAFIFTILKLPHTIGMFLLLATVWLLPFLLLFVTRFIPVLLLYPLIWVSIIGLAQNFYTNYIFGIYLNPQKENEEQHESQENTELSSDKDDDSHSKDSV
ncbi:hypothetical protein COB47_1310 [Caldicellulosiruptor obsidiansis OB47]|uniref:DUF624 domain-containing protein n=1 Tax=Caldicellulosiruptor obsidiansis (strain ATCC BAA-2073 / JCM 16842 / OB47) TaxID=608506 RepID=D9TKS0_CALOO|nr:DUF624 domain-containing protein [Caldicellulosiruptor obsidiansis]ADL42602.1 hypothetical protein COB47_1310 [Caldicellulosiruptor obsidiansis OB47]